MGMDAYIFAAHSKKELTNFNEYLTRVDEMPDDAEFRLGEHWYARKFWDLHNNMSFLRDYECGDFVLLSKDNLEEMITFVTHHRDYWDKFDSVIKLCEILDKYDEYDKHGIHFFYEADW